QHSPEPVSGSFQVLLDNQTALAAAAQKARELGYTSAILDHSREQPIEEGCELLLQDARDGCTISGGESSCPVRGDGRGGRNLETALRCAINLNTSSHFVIL